MAGVVDGFVVVGRFVGIHGLRGDVKVLSYTHPREGILRYAPWYGCFEGEWREIAPESATVKGKGLIARFAHHSAPEDGQRLMGVPIAVRRSQFPVLPLGEHYWHDLIGLDAVEEDGAPLGQVVDVIATGANDVLVVRGRREHLIPYVLGIYVKSVDLEHSRIEINWDLE
ncbi:MAG: Ribosome maturation factor RimM [Chromatiales bacterium USCg_Taylor]|jgi:16S rRNA processing protein RimM|nr:MAG: Ribosome maturation factor RimM [Chromatiales bacterium USCg_Taylor]